MGKFFFGILIYYGFLGILVGLNLLSLQPNLSTLSFFYVVLLLASGLWTWKSKKETEAIYQTWIISSLVFWIICLWNTGKLNSPYLFFAFLLPFFSAFLKGIRHFYLVFLPLLITSFYFIVFESGGDVSSYTEALLSKREWEVIYKVFFFVGPCLTLINLKGLQELE